MQLKADSAYEDETFLALDACEVKLINSSFCDVLFENCDFSNGDWSQAKFSCCRFKNCNLTLVNLNGCLLQEIIFEQCKIVGVDFYKCEKCLHLKFTECIVQTCNFTDLKLKKICFNSSKVRDTYFVNTELNEAEFQDTDLFNTVFHQCDLSKSNFTNAKNATIDIRTNQLKKAKFSIPEAINLLKYLDIEIVP